MSTCAHCILVTELWRNTTQMLNRTVLYQHREETGWDQLQQWASVSHGQGLLTGQSTQGDLCCSWGAPVPSPQGTDTAWGWQVPSDTDSSTTKERTRGLNQGKISPHRVNNHNTSCEDSLVIRKCVRPEVHSYIVKRKSRLLPFPTVSSGFCFFHIFTLALKNRI